MNYFRIKIVILNILPSNSVCSSVPLRSPFPQANVELKRATEYDLKIKEGKPNPDGEELVHISETETIDDASKKLCSHAFGEKVCFPPLEDSAHSA